MKKLTDIEQRLAKLEQAPKSEPKREAKQLSVAEFFLEKKPKSDVQSTLVIGYYLENYEKMTYFNKSDIETGFRQAKEKPPGNINEDVNQNIRQGFMMPAKEEKNKRAAWMLTNKGIKFVESGLRKVEKA